MPAAVEASVEAVTAPVVMNELKPGRGTDVDADAGARQRPVEALAPGVAGMECVRMLELQEVVEPGGDLREQRLHPAGFGGIRQHGGLLPGWRAVAGRPASSRAGARRSAVPPSGHGASWRRAGPWARRPGRRARRAPW